MLSMALLTASLALTEPTTAPNLFSEPLSPRIANYSIEVSLDEKQKLLHGHETLLWYNKSKNATKELQFHLYINGSRNSESTAMKEITQGGFLSSEKSADAWGFIDITRMSMRPLTPDELKVQYYTSQDWPELGAMENVTASIEYYQGDDNNINDKTVIKVQLSNEVPTGGAVLIDLDFLAKLSSPPGRSGAKEEFFMVSHWFPKIGVLEDSGWNTHQFHLLSEFFSDFGTYDVWMDLPADTIVGATGSEVHVSTESKGRKTHYYHAEDVHDFAWSSSPEFIEFTGQSQDVAIRVLMQPDHQSQGQRHLDAAITAVRYYQDWYGDYPFPNLTIIDPRRGAKVASAIEYPTLVVSDTFYGVPEGFGYPEVVILHEFGHQLFYHMLASNEFEESWLDEGITRYTETQILKDIYGPDSAVFDVLGIKFSFLQKQRYEHQAVAGFDTTIKNSWQYSSKASYVNNSYAKPALFLNTLDGYLGNELMKEIIRTYVKRFRFKHPTTDDFIQVASEVAQQDLNWFFDQALYSHIILDYSIANISSEPILSTHGYDYTLTTNAHLLSQKNYSKPQANHSDNTQIENPAMYNSSITVRRLGEFTFPVDVEVVFEDGEVVIEHWNGKDLWTQFSYVKSSQIQSATVDPQGKIPLDINYTNNSRIRSLDIKGVTAQTVSWLERFQVVADLLIF